MASFADRNRAVRIVESWGVANTADCIHAFEVAADPDRALDAFARWSVDAAKAQLLEVRWLATFAVLLETEARHTLLRLSPDEFLTAAPGVVPSFEAARDLCRRVNEGQATDDLATGLERFLSFMNCRILIAALSGAWTVRMAKEAAANLSRAAHEVLVAQTGAAMGYPLQVRLDPRLDKFRRRIQELHAETLSGIQVDLSDRARVGAALGAHSRAGLSMLDALPDAEEAYALLLRNEEALHRVSTVLETAPALVKDLRSSASLTNELLKSGFRPPTYLKGIELTTTPSHLATQFLREITRTKLAWALEPSFSLGEAVTAAYDALLKHICGRLCISLDLIALGSYGSREMSLASDLDLLVLARTEDLGARDQLVALLAFVAGLSRYGLQVELDVGLESESAKVRPGKTTIWTYEGFGDYELESMSLMERFNLGSARQIWGDAEAERIARKTAYALPLTPERLKDLVVRKKQLEAAVMPQHRRRDVKAGLGGLGDVEWFIHLHEMRFPTATRAGSFVELDKRAAALANTRLINSVELEELLEARKHLREVRHRLSLLGFQEDVIPENPDKLSRLAAVFGYADGNDFLAYHERVIDTVRGVYIEGLERLKA